MAYTFTTQSQVRRYFWDTHPNLPRKKIPPKGTTPMLSSLRHLDSRDAIEFLAIASFVAVLLWWAAGLAGA